MNTHQPYPRLTRTVVFFLAALAALAQSADPYPRISEEAYKARLPFFDYNKDIPLEARIVRDWDSKTTLRQKIVFRGAQGFLVPGYIEVPKHAPKPCALVLLLHGWSGGKENWWEDGNYVNGGELRKGLLDDGSAVLALDAPAHGERCSEIDYLHVNAYTDPNAPTKINYFNFTEIAVQTVRDYRRRDARGDIGMRRIGIRLQHGRHGFHLSARGRTAHQNGSHLRPAHTLARLRPLRRSITPGA